MITITTADSGGNTRSFRLVSDEFRIGFRPGAEISLVPFSSEAPEVRIQKGPEGFYVIEPVSHSDVFSIAGTPIEGTTSLAAGDMIMVADYAMKVDDIEVDVSPELEPPAMGEEAKGRRSTLRMVVEPGSSAVSPAADEKDVGPGAADEDESAPVVEQKAMPSEDSYIVLFFEPVRQYLEDDSVSEIMINGPKQIYVERKGKVVQTDAQFINEKALQAAVKNVARIVGRFFNADNPRLDARFPDGSRVHAVIPPLSKAGTVVAIRKFSKEKLTMKQLVEFGSISPEGVDLIDAVVKLHKNTVVSGPTSSGKTSVLNVLSSFIGTTERILVIEDSSELQLQQDHAVYFETRKPDEHGKGEVTIRDLVVSSLRLRPDRLIIGEIRGGEALDMLQAMNTGHSGSMTTIHANSPVDALSRIETCSLLSGVDIPLSAVRTQVASAIHVVVHTARLADGSRKITNISEVMPLSDGEYVVQDLIYFRAEGMDSEGQLVGKYVGGGVKPTFFDDAKLRGIKMEEKWFKAPPVKVVKKGKRK